MNDEALVMASLEAWGDAFCRKDVDRLMALYTPDAVIFDAIPPFSSDVDAMRAKVLDCIQYFPDGFAVERQDVTLKVDTNLAHGHCLWQFTGLPAGHPAGRHCFRSSFSWQRQADGRWLIVHDHCSAPFDPYTDKVVFSPDAGAPGNACETAEPRNPVGWFEIYVQDMARAKAFYTAVFGFEFTRLDSPIDLWAFPMLPGGGAPGALARIDGCPPSGNNVIVYFSCADCGVEAEKAAAAGGQIHKHRFSIGPYGFIALVVDTEGNMIGLHSMK